MSIEKLKLIRHEFLIKINKLKGIVSRKLKIVSIPSKIQVIIGMRRTGKTYFLYERIQHLMREGIDYSRILYLNLEDDRLEAIDGKQLAELVEQFYDEYPENYHQRCYIFFDEIQVVDGWSKLVRRLLDTKDIELFLTGSSAKLLSKEIATELRGRSIAYEMWPFSFKEYLISKAIEIEEPKSKIDLSYLKKHLSHYLSAGGFPEITILPLVEKNRVMQDYIDVVIYRDIIERHQITNLTLIKYMIKYLINNTATSISMNKLYNDLKSQGYSVGRNTLYEYLDHITDAYLAFAVPIYSDSIRKVESNPRKIYAVDSGLCEAYSFSTNNNYRRLFETMIFIDLKRRGDDVYSYLTEEKYEVDFFTRSSDGTLHLYQVAWDLSSPQTLAREQRALKAAEKELKVKGEIITPENYWEMF